MSESIVRDVIEAACAALNGGRDAVVRFGVTEKERLVAGIQIDEPDKQVVGLLISRIRIGKNPL